MSPDRLASKLDWRPTLAAVPMAWRRALAALGVAWCGLFVLFFPDWAAMADQWWDISTYNHVLLVPAIIAWLVHERLPRLANLAPQAWWPGLILVAVAAFLWVLGAFAGLSIARQAGAVALLAALVPTLLGPRVSVALAFPLAYLGFLVPFGDELVPSLQMVTAAITIALVHVSGIPAVIDGVFIDTPMGLFEVAEACSGVKFLIAMIAFGALAANVCFVSWRRRAIFMLVCIAVPILANGVRAWGTIFAAQFVGIETAAGFDHIVYGWFFFAVVIALVLLASWRFFDRPSDQAAVDADRVTVLPVFVRIAALRMSTLAALLSFAAILVLSQAWTSAADRLAAPLPAHIALPQVPGWHSVPYAPHVAWAPLASGADHRLLGRYEDGEGRQVDVFVALYASQREGREAGGFGQGVLPPGGRWAWHSPGPALAGAKGDRILAEGRYGRLALTWYRTGPLTTGSNARLKLANMADRLLLRARPTMTLILSSEEREGHSARDAVAAFHRAVAPQDRWMDQIAGVR